MKAVKTKVKDMDYTRPGEPLTEKELIAIVRKAEKGSFTDAKEADKEFEEWKKTLKD